jgi:hypothetical protein
VQAVYDLLVGQGFVIFPQDDNLIKAERAFFGARVIKWMRTRATEPDFNLEAYLVALTYYKLGLAEMKFIDGELMYRYRGIDLGGVEGEFIEDTGEAVGEFHRPDEPAKSSQAADEAGEEKE